MSKQFEKTVLPQNRMQLLVVPMSGTQAVTLFVFCKVGSRFERSSINGVSHYIEHLMFKGTTRRPTTLIISKELERLGAEFNAFTSKDHTGYYIKVAAKHIEKSVDILSDMLMHSVFDQTEMDRERKVIIEEIKMYEENPMMHIDDLFEHALFGDTPLGWSVAGPEKVLASVPRSDVMKFKEAYYQPANMVCVVAGKIDQDPKALITKYFGSYENGHTSFPQEEKASLQKQSFLVQFKQTEQAQVALGFPAYSYNDKRMSALEVLSTLFGGSMSSRLFINVRERLGLCYYIRSSVASFSDTGVLSIQTGVSSSKISDAVIAILKEVQEITRHEVADEELDRAKEYMKGKLILQMEASEKVAGWYAQEALFMDSIKTPEERLRDIDAVTKKDIVEVAQDIMRHERIVGACIGPIKQDAFQELFAKK